MKVPNNDKVFIPIEKIRGYILSDSHPVGRTKAAFFYKIGYNPGGIDLLINDLRKIVLENEVCKEIDTLYGQKYLVKGEIGIRFMKAVSIITIWIIEKEDSIPRFITAYPSNEEK